MDDKELTEVPDHSLQLFCNPWETKIHFGDEQKRYSFVIVLVYSLLLIVRSLPNWCFTWTFGIKYSVWCMLKRYLNPEDRHKDLLFFANLAVNYFTSTALHSADEISNEQQIWGLSKNDIIIRWNSESLFSVGKLFWNRIYIYKWLYFDHSIINILHKQIGICIIWDSINKIWKHIEQYLSLLVVKNSTRPYGN